jgi:AraC-like DNA-binding protein
LIPYLNELWEVVILGSVSMVITTIFLITYLVYKTRKMMKYGNRSLNGNNLSPKKVKILVIEINKTDDFSDFFSLIKNSYHIYHTEKISDGLTLVRQYPIDCVVTHSKMKPEALYEKYDVFNNQFPTIPIIIVTGEKIENQNSFNNDQYEKFYTIPFSPLALDKVIEEKIGLFKINYEELKIDYNKCPQLINRAIKFIEYNHTEIKSVQEVAERMKISREYLSREFKKSCSIPIKTLLMHVKLQHSIFLMKNSGLNLKEIADIVGFTNLQHFNKVFQRYHSCSPKTFRVNLKDYPSNITN